MKALTPQKVQTLISDIRYRLDELEEAASKAIPQKEWYTRSEFAEKEDLSPKTVSNYLSEGRFGKNQKKIRGHWKIHQSELNN